MFFDLTDNVIVNSHIVYTKLGNSISLLDLKLLLQSRWLEGIAFDSNLFLWVEQASKSTGVITAKENTNTHAGIQREVLAMQFLQK